MSLVSICKIIQCTLEAYLVALGSIFNIALLTFNMFYLKQIFNSFFASLLTRLIRLQLAL